MQRPQRPLCPSWLRMKPSSALSTLQGLIMASHAVPRLGRASSTWPCYSPALWRLSAQHDWIPMPPSMVCGDIHLLVQRPRNQHTAVFSISCAVRGGWTPIGVCHVARIRRWVGGLEVWPA
ncbi:hypothetical protein T440DRAFT_225016 [Plenodomus tracheiphilus IPT5]|uniref:Uncharacterized protein n=1 Tax=Plenodomus tracheiphilus IPT5 TaxID=1408161 RepID=A0A6A7AV41_9PLEO|nr:hypothetical protein T440DRAFT_225016 [Plenodomus tracheiphilus IPT5]